MPKLNVTPALAAWLLDSDPALRWQVLRDVLGAPAAEVASERRRVALEGHGARLLGLQAEDGTWAGAAWNRGWNSTMHALMLLREFGLDPDCPEARLALTRVREQVVWGGCGPAECSANAFFEGELEPCINGQVAAVGAYFKQDVSALIDRLLREQLADGGWNCEAPQNSSKSSFHTTICVLEALLEYDSLGGSPAATAARRRGEEYLLERRLFLRASGAAIRRDGKAHPSAAHPPFTALAFPCWWHYDVLRGLEHLTRAGAGSDERTRAAAGLLKSKRRKDGTWALEVSYAGDMPVELGEAQGGPSRWNTLRALRVLGSD